MSLADRIRKRQNKSRVPSLMTSIPKERVSKKIPLLEKVKAASEESKFNAYAEIARICDLEYVPNISEEEEAALSREFIEASAYNDKESYPKTGGFRFLPEQANAIAAYRKTGGAFCPVGVGFGKTGISLVCARIAITERKKRRVLLLIPPQVTTQLDTIDMAFWRKRVNLPFATFFIAGKSAKKRKILASSGRPGLYVMAYSQLQTADSEDILEALDPEVVILDEAHMAADKGSRRSARLYRFLSLKNPEVICLSGTITQKKVKEYFKLSRFALKEGNFLPNSVPLMEEWSQFLDADTTVNGDFHQGFKKTGAIMPVLNWAKRNAGKTGDGTQIADFREAYKLRMVSCKGVFSSGDKQVGNALTFYNLSKEKSELESYKGYDKVKEIAKKIEDEWIAPNGDEIEYAIHKWKWLSEIEGAGYYNNLKWPKPEKIMKRINCTTSEAEDMIFRAKQHHGSKQEYHKLVRSFLNNRAIPHCDTPMLIGREFALNGTEKMLFREREMFLAWQDVKSLEFEGMPTRESDPVRICDFKIDMACTWAGQIPKSEGGIIWYHHNEIGKWLYEYISERVDRNIIHCPAGKEHNKKIINPSNNKSIVIASIGAHGTGKNLQYVGNQLFAEWARAANVAEQAIGRLHRTGQEADEVKTYTLNVSNWDNMNFAATLNDALYISQTTGNMQKLIYAGYEPTPEIFPSHVLAARGSEATSLSKAQSQLLQEKFGKY